MKNLFLQTVFSLTILLLLIGLTLIPTALTTKNNVIYDSCDIPTWWIGDSWIYTADPVSYYSQNGSFDGRIEDLKREVLDVTTISHGDDEFEVYQVGITGNISGEMTWEILSGDLEGEIQGVSYIRIIDLAEVKTELVSTGTVYFLFIDWEYEMTNTNLFFPPLELYDFPLKIYDLWEISCNSLSSGSFIVEDLIQEEFSESGWLDQTMQCTGKESVSVPAGDFESYKITYSSDTIWYSPEVGNIVKSEVDHSGSNNSFNMDLSLESFSRGTQPINISEKIDPSEALIDQEINISGHVVDSNSDPIQNADVSIEIPRIGQSWFTSTDDEGYYIKTIEAPYIFDDTPSPGEFGSDGVIVRCSVDELEGYKIKSLLTIANLPPNSPVIKGPVKGKPGVYHEYEFYSTDADADELYYFVDWGDGTDSGWKGPYFEEMVLSHTWDEEGSFNIRAKAKDIYSESDWGELEVNMPKNKILPFYLFENLFNLFPNSLHILRFLFSLI